MVLVGPSGCGKTTLLRMVAGLEEITEGTIRVGDRVINDVDPKNRDLAMVFQNYALYPHMTCYDNMAFGLKLRKLPKKEIDRRVARDGQDAGAGRPVEEEAAGAVGRPAPAGGDGPGDRPRAEGVPDGRAALQPGRQAAGADAHRDLAHPARPGRDHDLRHPRPDRGDDHGRQGGGDEPRRAAAGGGAAGDVRRPGQPVRGRFHRPPRHEHGRRRARSAATAAPRLPSAVSGCRSPKCDRGAAARWPAMSASGW